MIELLEFQRQAADTIADRYAEYWEDPAITGRRNNPRALPFFQSLASITASGKTVILAAAVADIASGLAVKPIVLWISRGKVVVEQSYANLAEGGKYHHLLGDADVRPLSEYDNADVSESTRPLVYFATVGTFNQRDKEQGDRLIYRCDIDTADRSTWDSLKGRLDQHGQRRPLLVVYDEAHNLSDQQTDLLLELDPQALLMASATMRLPARLGGEIQELKAKTGHHDSWLVTQVDAAAVADAGLVKSTVLLAGYKSPMEETLDALLDDLHQTERDAEAYGLPGKPKAIYISQTNIVEGNAYATDNPKQPFAQRQAPPILIWRYLVEHHHIDPSTIAVYCSLKFDRNYPAPDEFRLFRGGDNDYPEFIAGDFQHVIFNLSLQEGWDDPLAYFAYIDKSMESRIQVEQVIGRLLRQPGVQHYASERLNTAHFYVRVDRHAVFDSLINDVGRRLGSEAPEVKIVSKPPDKQKPTELPPRDFRSVPGTGYDTSEAIGPIDELIRQFTDYRGDSRNTAGEGARRLVSREIGSQVDLNMEAQWEIYKRSNIVSARWLFTREVRRLFQNALGIAPTSDPKFDALVGVGSPAHTHIQTLARQVVDAYLDNVYLKQRKPDPYVVGPQLVRTDEMITYKHSLHEGYDGLNRLEGDFAEAIDRLGSPWCCNPSRTGYGIPLITPGTTNIFYPDFLVWVDAYVFAIDTAGGHVLPEKAARKLLAIQTPSDAESRVVIRFVSQGRWTASPQLAQEDTEGGFTVWELSPNQERRAIHVADLDGAVVRSVRAPY
jgi:type III restriction enzyme